MDDEIMLNEKADVITVFQRKGLHTCRPARFSFKNREITVSKVGLVFPVRKDGVLVHIFDVSDGAADFRLEFNTARLTWRVTKEADHYEAA